MLELSFLRPDCDAAAHYCQDEIAASDDDGRLRVIKHGAKPIPQGRATACHSYDHEYECGDFKSYECGDFKSDLDRYATSLMATPQPFFLECN
jgi:hypothetical protein